MKNRDTTSAQATASGVTDAPALMNRNRGAGAKSTTGYTAKMFTPKREVTVASWNVRTAYHVGQKEIIARELVKYKENIAALSELRLTESGRTKIPVPDRNAQVTLFYSGGDKHTEGVGFALDEKAVNCVLAFYPISSRIAVLMLSVTNRTHIFSVYAPTEISPDDAKDDFYNSLQTAIDWSRILIAGDFYARVGNNRTGWEEVPGRHDVGEVSDNDVRLLTFAAANGLLIGNSIFQHRQIHQLTWRTPNGSDPALLDYVLINRRFRSSISDIRVKRGADCGSDHHLVCARIRLRLQKARGSTKRIIRRNWSILAEPSSRPRFQLKLANRFASLAEKCDVDEEERQFTSAVCESAEEICPIIRQRTQPWISEACLDLIDQRKRAKPVNRERYAELNRATQCQLKLEREAYWNSVAEQAEDAACRNEFRALYATLRRPTGQKKPANDNIRKADGSFTKSHEERLQRWKEFFETMYNHTAPGGPQAAPPSVLIAKQVTVASETTPTRDEVTEAIKLLRNSKAAGIDGVTAEALKAGEEVLVNRLHSLLKLIWRAEKFRRHGNRPSLYQS